nr:MAG TPA: hypothetical protein [Caudoviricetes sp.]
MFALDNRLKYLKTILFHNKSLLFFTKHTICDKITILLNVLCIKFQNL